MINPAKFSIGVVTSSKLLGVVISLLIETLGTLVTLCLQTLIVFGWEVVLQ